MDCFKGSSQDDDKDMASGLQSKIKTSVKTEDTSVKPCDACKFQNITSEGISYCTVCAEYLCKRCKRAHKGSKASRDHTVLTGTDMPTENGKTKPVVPTMYCETHKTMPLHNYCKGHGEVICGTCRITNHRQCSISDIREQSNQMKKNGAFIETVKGLTSLKVKYGKLKERRKRDKELLNIQLQTSIEKLNQLRKDIMAILDNMEKKCRNEVSIIEERLLNDMDNHIVISDDALTQIDKQLKSMLEYQTSRDQDVMFIGMNRASILKSKYDDTLSHMEQEICPIKYQIEPKMAKVITDVTKEFKSLESFESVLVNNGGANQSNFPTSLMNMTVTGRQEVSVSSYHAFGCTFMPDGSLVAGCGSNGLNVLDKDFKITSQLPDFSFQVAAVSDNQVIVTQGTLKALKVVKLVPSAKVERTMSMDRNCYGVDVNNDEIFVTCHDNPGGGEIQVLNMEGKLQRRLGVNNGKHVLVAPSYIQVSKDGNKVFVSDRDTDTVTCYSTQGHVIYQYADRELRVPTGMFVDDEDNILVCGYQSFNVHLVRQDGRKEKVLMSTKHGVECPLCIAYRPRDGCVAIGLDTYTDKAMVLVTTDNLYGYVT